MCVCCVFHSERTENGQKPPHVFSTLTSVLNKGVANGKSFRFFFFFIKLWLVVNLYGCLNNWFLNFYIWSLKSWICVYICVNNRLQKMLALYICSKISPFYFCLNISESLESPEPPVFCTPGFKIEKHRMPSSPPLKGKNDLDSPPRPNNCPSTPELPAFETPFVSKLIKKVRCAP